MDLQRQEKKLPQFRKDLEIYRGPDGDDGSPTYNLYDPRKEKYYKIGWAESLIFQLAEPKMTPKELIKKVHQHSTLRVTEEDIESFYKLAFNLNLLILPKSSEQLLEEEKREKQSIVQWFLSHYMYFRIPLFNPNLFLEKTLYIVDIVWSKAAKIFYALLSTIGIVLLVGRFEEYLHTFPYFFSLSGVFYYSFVLFIVKIIHEFSHAYTAKYYGVNVRSMGVVFLVFIPVLYTDVTHSWRLENRKHRSLISFAGIAAELILAGIATFVWGITEPGLINSAAFILSSTSIITSILFNANPLLKYDGYYILLDFWGIENLQSRAFGVAQWKIRYWLLGILTPSPEPQLLKRTINWMVLYAVLAWFYRLGIYTSVSLFIYYTFTKTIGLFLLATTTYMYFIRPIYQQVKEIIAIKDTIQWNLRMKATLGGSALFLLWFTIPLPHTVTFSGITSPLKEQVIYVPYGSKVKHIFVERNDYVVPGQPIINLKSEQLDSETQSMEIDAEIINREIDIYSYAVDPADRTLLDLSVQKLSSVKEDLVSLLNKKEKMFITAEIAGEIREWNNHLWEGQSLARDTILGKIIENDQVIIKGYLKENKIEDVKVGQQVTFRVNSSLKEYPGRIRSIQNVGSQYLYDPQLASIHGGEIPVTRDREGKLELVDSYYFIEIEVEENNQPKFFGSVGTIFAPGKPKSHLISSLQNLKAILWRQSEL